MDSEWLAQFKVRLAQTIYWCERHADLSYPESSLRTKDLRPGPLEESRRSAVEFVVHSRELYGLPEIKKATLPNHRRDKTQASSVSTRLHVGQRFIRSLVI